MSRLGDWQRYGVLEIENTGEGTGLLVKVMSLIKFEKAYRTLSGLELTKYFN